MPPDPADAGTGIGLPIACPSLALGSFWGECPTDIFFFQKTGARRGLEFPL